MTGLVDTRPLPAAKGGLFRFDPIGLAFPAMLFLAVIGIIPILCLVYLSFVDAGAYSTAHYARILQSATYLAILKNTILLSLWVTALAVLLGYPLCYFIVGLPPRWRPLVLALVSLPLWTSILVRTFAWLILLQRQGVVNSILQYLGLTAEPIQLVANLFGAMVGMLHIVLPLFVLPVYVAMTKVDRQLMQAAAGLGAGATRAFWTVFFPLTLPGVAAGTLIVFIYCLGFYITPEILGGGRVMTVSMKVAENAMMYSEWGASSSLATILLIATFLVLGASKLVIAMLSNRWRAP